MGAVKAAKAAKALKAAKSMKAAGSAAKGAKATKGASAAKKARLQKGADRLVKRDQRRTEMKKNMEARAKQQEQQSSGESKKKKESIKELYDKSREGLERKDRRSDAMSNFATKGTMKHGGKYEDGGRKGPLKKLKGAIKKANHKAGAVKNRLEKKVLDAVKRKKAEKGMKYENGGKLSKSKRPKKMEKMSGAKERGQVGNPMGNKFRKELDKISKGSRADLMMRVYAGKTAKQHSRAIQRSQEVPNPGLGKKTEDFGTSFGKVTGRQGNPGGLKGKTKGKGGNVGAGVKVKKKRRR